MSQNLSSAAVVIGALRVNARLLQITDNLVNAVKGSEIEILSQEIFDQDPLTRIENLKVNRPASIKTVLRKRPFDFYRGEAGRFLEKQ